MFTVQVPLDSGAGVRRPVQRPESDHRARLLRSHALIETERFENPPDDYEVVSGDVHPCETCGALFDSQPALAGHGQSHSDGA